MQKINLKKNFSLKRILISTLCVIVVMGISYSSVKAADPTSPQWVSKNIQKRTVVLEEHTGWQCQYCPTVFS